VIEGGRRIAADAIVWATSAAAAPWLAASGLGTDERGFVCVDDYLRSVSHPFVFAAGDCATLASHRHPKSGLYAVRHGPPLATNLLAHAHGRRLQPYRPQPRGLALIGTGDRAAILSWGPLAAKGRWVWRWKERIDRAFVARYTEPADPATGASAGVAHED
jgi:selenide,water dikinase